MSNQSGLLFLLVGFALFQPMFILLYPVILFWPSFNVGLLFCMFPLNGAVIGFALGLLTDLSGKRKEADEEADKRDTDVFIRISRGKKKAVVITEKSVNNCIIAGVIIWALVIVSAVFMFAD